MKIVIKNKEKQQAILTTDGKNAKVEGDLIISDIVREILNKKELKHRGQIESFPKNLIATNENGVAELRTASVEYLEQYLPEFCEIFGLTVEFIK